MSRTRVVGRAGIAAVALAVLGADLFVLAGRGGTTPVAVDDVVGQYRRSAKTTVPAAPATPVTTTTLPPTTRPSASSAAVARRDATAPPAVAEAAFGLPKDGVYTYETAGGETASLGGSRHDYPALTYATVRRRSGCEWSVEQPLVKEHVDRRVFCARADALLFMSQTTTVTFFHQSATDQVRCDPPQVVLQRTDPVGSRRDYVCRSDSNESRVRVTRLGPERIDVGGRGVDVEHVLMEGVLTGQATGTSRVEQWWLPTSGLIVSELRSVTSRAHEFGATIDYREHVTLRLRSLEPQT